MENLRYLEITRTFNNYYKTLRDMNVYLQNDPDVDKEDLRAASLVISRLIFEFIRVNGTTLREMNEEEFEKDYQIFKGDFLTIIQSSGENNVDFEELAELVDDLLKIADLRAETLGKINRELVEDPSEDEDDEVDFMDVEEFQDEDEDEDDEVNENPDESSSERTDDEESSESEDESSDTAPDEEDESEDEIDDESDDESIDESNGNEDESSAHLVQEEDEDEEYDEDLGDEDLVEVKIKVEIEEENARNNDYEEYESQDYRIYRRKRYD